AGAAGVGGSGDLATDDEIIGSIAKGIARGRDSLLIAFGSPGGAHARGDELHIGPRDLPDTAHFQGRTDDSVHAAGVGFLNAQFDKFGYGHVVTQVRKIVLIEAG